jgi:hypothetical protein
MVVLPSVLPLLVVVLVVVLVVLMRRNVLPMTTAGVYLLLLSGRSLF